VSPAFVRCIAALSAATWLAVPAAAAPVNAFNLELRVAEHEIRNGELRTLVIVRRFVLPAQAVQRSRNFAKLSSALEPSLREVFARLERPAVDARWTPAAGGWAATQRSAWTLDETATRARLTKALVEGKSSSVVAVTVRAPQRSVEAWYEQGVRAHFAGGESAFYGSAPFRVQNIRVGSSLVDGVTIAKNGVFDFNATVGDITADQGFVDGYVIKSGTLAKEVGGGICQVSTTVFRAAYLGGLPVVQRNFHSYRVSYYELATRDFAPPIGFEATVYAPYKNLKFKNDTGAPIFVQVSVDVRRYTMRVDLFGRAPDRRVRLSRPVFGPSRPAPAPRFQPDAGVALGQQRRIDGAVNGVSVSQTRTVRYANGGVRTDRLFSNYVPWGAIYAVNPRDPRLETVASR
jgi:vancomycin resistance protein YoaR